MALEQLSLGPGPVDGGADGRQPTDEATAGGDEGAKIARLPRWTREEILVLIRGKRAAENRGRRGRAAAGGPGQAVEPKWESVASYCKRHGVNRGPVQCRKRWSNLAADFKKIKEWESRAAAAEVGENAVSFWAMRNDLRRERKLPGFFDREVYEIIDSGGEEIEAGGGLSLALAPAEDEGAEPPEALFDSGRSAAADDGLFSDSEHPNRSDPDPNPNPASHPFSVSEEQKDQTFGPESSAKGKENEKQPDPEAEDRSTQEGKKRKRSTTEEGGVGSADLDHQLIEAMNKNSELLSSLLESQNVQLQLDREQRNDHVNGLLTVFNKLADALVRIADKL